MSRQGNALNFCNLVLDMTPSAVITVDESCTVLFANGQARTILAREDGLKLATGQVVAIDHEVASALRRVVKECAAAYVRGTPLVEVLSVPRENARLPLLLRLSPAGQGLCVSAKGAALMFIGEPEGGHSKFDAKLLQRLHGLTEREAQLAILLAMGKRMGDAASAMGITYNTARDHLRTVLSKTRASSQAELLRLVWASPVWPG